MELSGSIVALVTPFKNDRVDESSLKKLVEFHLDNGTSGLVPCGTTGESATLTEAEHERVIEVVVQAARGRIPVIAGTGSNDTREAVKLTRFAKKAGADAALLICPYYNKPTQEGLYRHFKAVAEAVDIPQVPYNIMSRTGVNMAPETVARLAQLKNVVAIKESSGNLEQMSRVIQLCGGKISLLSGDDWAVLPVLAIGGTGVISVAANIMPRETANMVAAFRRGDSQGARELFYRTFSLVRALFIETSPIPVKTAMSLMGLIKLEMRLPLCEMEPGNLKTLKHEMKLAGLIR